MTAAVLGATAVAAVPPLDPFPCERPIADGLGLGASAAVRTTTSGPVVWIHVHGDGDGLLDGTGAEVVRRGVHDATSGGIPVVLHVEMWRGPAAGVVGLDGWGRAARALAAASGVVPLVGLVTGTAASGAALLLGLLDVVVLTVDATLHVSGPTSVAATTGRSVTGGDLGGARVHAVRSGVAHLLAHDPADGTALVDELLVFLPPNNAESPPVAWTDDPADRSCPSLERIVPADPRAAYDVRDVAREVLDDGHLLELQAGFGPAMVCGLGHLAGHAVGVVANQPAQQAGAIDVEASQKAARFVQWCDAFGVPLLTLVDTPGYLPGRDLEWQGMIRHGGQLAVAYAAATVPRMCVVLRKAYGGAYIVMDSKAMGSDLSLAWPHAEIAVMGAAGAVQILHGRRLAALPSDESAEERARAEAGYAVEHLGPERALACGAIDAVVAPADTRRVLAAALPSLLGKRSVRPGRKHHNGPL